MKKSYLLLFFVLLSTCTFAQKNINSYKYIIVPKRYDFQKSEDSHQINSLTKFLFEREGFITLFSNDTYPNDLVANSCLGLKVNVVDLSGFLSTKIKMDLVDCRNIIVFSTKEAKSRIKDYKKAYQEVIRKSFEDIEALNYNYSGSGEAEVIEEAEVEDVEESNDLILGEEIDIEKEVVSVEVIEKNVSEQTDKIIDVKEIKGVEREVVVKLEDEIEKRAFKSVIFKLEGTYLMDNWGKCLISKKGTDYALIGGDENFEFATIYTTSKANIYIIKWAAFKQPQLLEVDKEGNLSIDTKAGVKIYKKVN